MYIYIYMNNATYMNNNDIYIYINNIYVYEWY